MRLKLGLAACLLALGCDEPASPPGAVRSARFGILFGGQVQQRDELPFELDRAKQQQGFRIELARPLDAPQTITWELSRPSGSRRGPERITVLGRGEVAAGQTVFEQPIPFKPGDPLGLWNIRVVLGERVLIDRPFVVYDKGRRLSAHPDAGLTVP